MVVERPGREAADQRLEVLGSFHFDPNGDITTSPVPILRVTGETPPNSDLPSGFRGAVLDRVIDVPASLVR